jgi:hypothetical protein
MKQIILIIMTLIFSAISYGHEITPEQRKQKIELHEKMAEHHKMAAECLKAGKPLDVCNAEAMHDCPMMGKNCPFIEKGHMDKEMMREHMKKMKESKASDG